jgi:hypothetical protein
VRDQRPGFETEGVLDVPLGLREIVEGQARVCEIQFRTFTQRAMTWKEVTQAGWLRSVYGKAFSLYLQWTGLHEPESPRSSHVDLFLLLCDIAINPSVGYAETLLADTKFVADFHPGLRFMRLCKAIAKDKELVKGFRNPTPKAYEMVAELHGQRLQAAEQSLCASNIEDECLPRLIREDGLNRFDQG